MYILWRTTGFRARGFEDGKEFWETLALEDAKACAPGYHASRGRRDRDLEEAEIFVQDPGDPVIMVTAKGAGIRQGKRAGPGSGRLCDQAIWHDGACFPGESGASPQRRRLPGIRRLYVYLFLAAGDIEIDTQKHEVTAAGEVVNLTLKEYELLKRLMENQNVVMTRDRLLEDIWGYDFDGETRTVDVHVRTLRQKLGSCGDKIETVRGVGYRMSKQES